MSHVSPLRALRASSFQCDGVISLCSRNSRNSRQTVKNGWSVSRGRFLKSLITDRILDQFPGDLSLIKKFGHRQFSKYKGLQMVRFPQVP